MSVTLNLTGLHARVAGVPTSHRTRSRGGVGSVLANRASGPVSAPTPDGSTTIVLALDVGTTALKGALVTPSGELLSRSSEAYASGTQTGSGGQVEQRPDDWAEAVGQVASRLLSQVAADVNVSAISLSGQMQDVVLVADGGAVRPALLYSDVRASTEAEDIERTLGRHRIATALDNYKGAASCLAKWLWLARNEPTALVAADAILLGAHSYVAYRLTGGMSATDLTTASTTGLLNRSAPSGPRWAAPEIEAFTGLDVSLLPELPSAHPLRGSFQPTAPLGRVTDQSVSELGLPRKLAGVSVFHGVGDVASTTIGATGLSAGGAYLYLGTSGWVATCVPDDEESRDRKGDGLFNLLHSVPGLCTLAASMTTAGGNVEWARRLLQPPGASLSDFDKLAMSAPPGCGGTLYMPHLQGERSPFTDPAARAGFLNLSANTTSAHLARAVLEGVALNYRALVECLSLPPGKLLPVVGGGANSEIWMQILADCLQTPLMPQPDADAVAARGCSVEAMMCLGSWSNSAPPSGFFATAERGVVMPDPGVAALYDDRYTVFRELYPALKRTSLYAP